jgi:hypothetical protein
VLVRGLAIRAGPTRWEPERREHGGVLLSDHTPVDLVVE